MKHAACGGRVYKVTQPDLFGKPVTYWYWCAGCLRYVPAEECK